MGVERFGVLNKRYEVAKKRKGDIIIFYGMVLGEEVLLYYHSRHALEDNLKNLWIVKFLIVCIQYNIGYLLCLG